MYSWGNKTCLLVSSSDLSHEALTRKLAILGVNAHHEVKSDLGLNESICQVHLRACLQRKDFTEPDSLSAAAQLYIVL